MFYGHKRIKLGIRSGKVSEKILKYLEMTQCNSKYSSMGQRRNQKVKLKNTLSWLKVKIQHIKICGISKVAIRVKCIALNVFVEMKILKSVISVFTLRN